MGWRAGADLVVSLACCSCAIEIPDLGNAFCEFAMGSDAHITTTESIDISTSIYRRPDEGMLSSVDSRLVTSVLRRRRIGSSACVPRACAVLGIQCLWSK